MNRSIDLQMGAKAMLEECVELLENVVAEDARRRFAVEQARRDREEAQAAAEQLEAR